MVIRWLDPQLRRGLAMVVLVLSVAGIVLADRGGGFAFASSPVAQGAGPYAVGPDPAIRGPGGLRTAFGFQGFGLHGRFAVSQGKLLASGTRSLYVELRVAADERTDAVARSPIAMALVVDTSGSMAGDKIVDARRAAHALVDEMRPDDALALVRYATTASLVLPLGRVADVRYRAHAEIDRFYANGSTDIAGGLRTAAAALAQGPYEPLVRRVVLVTDGRDTSGAPRSTASGVARMQSARNVSVSALGIGDDYDDAYLADLADAGRGNYEYLRDASSLTTFLSKELRETSQTTIQDVTARIELPAGARVREVWGATAERTGGGRVDLRFGPLYARDERRAMLLLDVDVGAPGTTAALRSEVSWVPVGRPRIDLSVPAIQLEATAYERDAEESRDTTVLASATSVTASQRERAAAQAFEKGDRARAMELNRQNIDELSRAAQAAPSGAGDKLRAQQRAYEQNQKVYSTQPPAAAPARSIGAREHKNADRDVAY